MSAGQGVRPRAETAFLPAALEIVHSPASPLGRSILWVILVLFSAGIAWAGIGQLDVVAVGRGKAVAQGHSKVVQPSSAGIVRDIRVREGQSVTAGQVLVELDATEQVANQARIGFEVETVRIDVARLQELLAAVADARDPDAGQIVGAMAGGERQALDDARSLLHGQFEVFRNERELAQQEIERTQAQLNAVDAEHNRITAILPLLEQRTQAVFSMSEQNLMPKVAYLELEQERTDLSQARLIQRERKAELRVALVQAQLQLKQHRVAFLQALREKLKEAQLRHAVLEQEAAKAAESHRRQQLRSPIDGRVQQLSIHTEGGVVTPAQELMVIVPDAQDLIIEAWIENKDVGFVHAGQDVAIKLDAFPFTKHGVIDGRLTTISRDAIADQQGQFRYLAQIELLEGRSSSSAVTAEALPVAAPGMAATVEIKTGKRRILEYLLSPLLQSVQETARER